MTACVRSRTVSGSSVSSAQGKNSQCLPPWYRRARQQPTTRSRSERARPDAPARNPRPAPETRSARPGRPRGTAPRSHVRPALQTARTPRGPGLARPRSDRVAFLHRLVHLSPRGLPPRCFVCLAMIRLSPMVLLGFAIGRMPNPLREPTRQSPALVRPLVLQGLRGRGFQRG